MGLTKQRFAQTANCFPPSVAEELQKRTLLNSVKYGIFLLTS